MKPGYYFWICFGLFWYVYSTLFCSMISKHDFDLTLIINSGMPLHGPSEPGSVCCQAKILPHRNCGEKPGLQ
jgi:hypothetical protein